MSTTDEAPNPVELEACVGQALARVERPLSDAERGQMRERTRRLMALAEWLRRTPLRNHDEPALVVRPFDSA
jgi:hypothetical protein